MSCDSLACVRKLFHPFFFGFLLVVAPRVWAAAGTEGASFLDIPVGAGPAALGAAYASVAKDAYAPIYNPAGLARLSNPQVAAQHLSYLDSINDEFGSVAIPLGPLQGVGFAVQYLGSGDIRETNPSGAAVGTFDAYYAAYSLAYGRRLSETWAVGLTGKAIEAKISDTSASAYAVDVGTLYEASDQLTVSATANNLGSKLKFSAQGDTLPQALHVGAAYRFTRRVQGTAEEVYSKSVSLSERLGAEWDPLPALALRMGYRTDTLQKLSPIAGLSVGLGLHFFGQEVAYAWLPYGDLGNTQYVSALIHFGASPSDRRNLAAYQVKTARTSTDPEEGSLNNLLKEDPDLKW